MSNSCELFLEVAQDPATLGWASDAVSEHHYLHKPPDRRSRPLCYVVRLATHGYIGCLWFGRPESTRCFHGTLTYGSRQDAAAGRAAYDRWEVLNLSRVWLCSSVQPGGDLYRPDFLPGFVDRQGHFRSTLASTVIRLALARVGFDYLRLHPPVFVDEPYAIRAVLSYCDTRLHRGTIYRAAGWLLGRRNAAGLETWWTGATAPLLKCQDREIRRLAAVCPRSVRIRDAQRQLFSE